MNSNWILETDSWNQYAPLRIIHHWESSWADWPVNNVVKEWSFRDLFSPDGQRIDSQYSNDHITSWRVLVMALWKNLSVYCEICLQDVGGRLRRSNFMAWKQFWESDTRPVVEEWSKILKVKIPSEIRVFLWRLAQYSSPMEDMRHHGNMAVHNHYAICGQRESWRHSLLECNLAKPWGDNGFPLSGIGSGCKKLVGRSNEKAFAHIRYN